MIYNPKETARLLASTHGSNIANWTTGDKFSAYDQLAAAKDRIEMLEGALRDVCNPVAKFARERQPDEKLDGLGMAYALKDIETYKAIAKEALDQIKPTEKQNDY